MNFMYQIEGPVTCYSFTDQCIVSCDGYFLGNPEIKIPLIFIMSKQNIIKNLTSSAEGKDLILRVPRGENKIDIYF